MSQIPLPYQTPPSNLKDLDHIKLLVIFSYVWGALIALFSSIGLIHVILGTLFVTKGSTMFPTTGPNAGPPPVFFGWFFIAIGGTIVLSGWTIGALNLYSARSMQLRKRRTLSLIVAGLNCMSFPLGTAVGVFTFIVLLRESVAQLYRYGVMQGGHGQMPGQ